MVSWITAYSKNKNAAPERQALSCLRNKEKGSRKNNLTFRHFIFRSFSATPGNIKLQ